MRHWICAVALCALAVPAAADAPLAQAARGAPAYRSARAVKFAPAATPTRDTGGVSAPLPRSNPGDPVARSAVGRADSDAETQGQAAGQARASDTEAKESVALGTEGGSHDTEDK